MPHIVTTAPTIIPNNDTVVPMPIRVASLSPPGVPVVSLVVAAEDKNVIDAYTRHSVLLYF